MSDYEICRSYREERHKAQQIQIIAELCGRQKLDIIAILIKNGEKPPESEVNKLFKRLDELENQIREREREYRAIAAALKGE